MDYQSRLNNIIAKPGNKCCADCNGRNPRWVSISLGVFVCIRCCGIHRSLGTHISKMKSTTLDKWSPQMLAIFEAIDNEVANGYWEANIPQNCNKPVESSSSYAVENFLRDKYDRKLWKGSGPDPVTLALNPPTSVKQPKKEEKRTHSSSTTDLLIDSSSTHSKIPHFPSANLIGQSNDANLFSQNLGFPPVSNPLPNNPGFTPQYSNPSQYNPAPVYPQPANIAPFNSASIYSQPGSINPQFTSNPVYSQPVNNSLYPNNQGSLNNFGKAQNNLDAEKNMKINQVLSMYGPQQPSPVTTVNNNGFKPLGAIAAQNFINSNLRSQPTYPTF